MAQQTTLNPEKVTRPFQLLAAWLAGLLLLDGSFLAAASQIHSPEWASAVLVIASVANVPLFLVSIFLLQTKFRPEMQEDPYYAKYLEHKYSSTSSDVHQVLPATQSEQLVEKIVKEIGPSAESKKEEIEKLITTDDATRIAYRVGQRRTLSELFLRPERWSSVVTKWRHDEEFQEDLHTLTAEGVIVMKGTNLESCELTPLGREVAEVAQRNNVLWHQTHSERAKREDKEQ